MPFKPRKKPEPLDEAALYQYAVGALARQMRTVAELKRLMSRRVEARRSRGSQDSGGGRASAGSALSRRSRVRLHLYPLCARKTRASASAACNRSSPARAFKVSWWPGTIESAYAHVSEEDLVRRYIARKRIAKPEDEKQTARLIRRLIGAGFSFAIISKVLKTWQIDCSEIELLMPEDDDAE